MKRSLALFFLIIFFISCSSDRVPDGVISQEEMIKVLTDIHLADGYASVNYADTGRFKIAALYEAIYKKYDTDSLQVRRSIEYYTRHPDKMQSLYEKVSANLNQYTKESQVLEEQMYRQQQKRISDSLFYHDKKRDSVNRGFKIDTLSYAPFQKFVPKVLTTKVNNKAVVNQGQAVKDSLMRRNDRKLMK